MLLSHLQWLHRTVGQLCLPHLLIAQTPQDEVVTDPGDWHLACDFMTRKLEGKYVEMALPVLLAISPSVPALLGPPSKPACFKPSTDVRSAVGLLNLQFYTLPAGMRISRRGRASFSARRPWSSSCTGGRETRSRPGTPTSAMSSRACSPQPGGYVSCLSPPFVLPVPRGVRSVRSRSQRSVVFLRM